MDSIAAVGLMNPITVFERPIIRNGQTVPGYGLVAGAHRLEACKRLGIAEVECRVVDLDEQTRIIAECDENLCGTRLSPADVALFTARRKQAYEVLHPETAKPGPKDVANSATIAPRFTADTAAKTGKSERQVQRHAERGKASPIKEEKFSSFADDTAQKTKRPAPVKGRACGGRTINRGRSRPSAPP